MNLNFKFIFPIALTMIISCFSSPIHATSELSDEVVSTEATKTKDEILETSENTTNPDGKNYPEDKSEQKQSTPKGSNKVTELQQNTIKLNYDNNIGIYLIIAGVLILITITTYTIIQSKKSKNLNEEYDDYEETAEYDEYDEYNEYSYHNNNSEHSYSYNDINSTFTAATEENVDYDFRRFDEDIYDNEDNDYPSSNIDYNYDNFNNYSDSINEDNYNSTNESDFSGIFDDLWNDKTDFSGIFDDLLSDESDDL